MKDDKPKGKSQKDQSRQEISDSQIPSFQKDEEDVDFEILDALEQIEQTGKVNGESLPNEESKFELSLDEEEILFDEEAEEEGEFRIDESLTTGLEEEFTGKAEEFGLDESLGDESGEDVHAGIEDESFSIDLDQEDAEGEGDLSFDEEMDLELEAETGETSFDLGEIGDADFSQETDVEEEIEDTSSEMLDLGEDASDMLSSEEYSLDTEDLSSQESSDLGLEDIDETFGEMDLEDMSDISGNLDFETDMGDESTLGMEFSEMGFEDEADEFSGKSVISVGGDQVIDLGSEPELDQEEELGITESSYEGEDQEADESFGMLEGEEDVDLAELEKGARQMVESTVSDLTPEQEQGEEEQDEEFIASLGEIDIDLEEETTKVLEALEGADEFSGFAEKEPSDFDLDSFDITPDEEQESEAATLGAGISARPLSETGEEQGEEAEIGSEMVRIEIDEAAEVPEPEVDEHEELGLTPRLTDSEIHKFESMVNEAKTLQRYVEELEEHKADIKEKIYQKLLQEYTSRKTDIFKEPEFISIRFDVDQDLQDMLAKRTEFVSTIERLNDELEEVKVRHLVGEYTDTMLSEREAAQKAEIAQWHEKTERIEKFITRYQELLDTERELNPLEGESTIEEAEQEILPEQELVSPVEEIAEGEKMISHAEEMLPEEEIVAPAEGVSEDEAEEDMEIESLADSFAEDFGLDEFSEMDEGVDEEQPAFGEEIEKDETDQEDMINCKKCGRLTPTSEKFCVNCGAKAR